MECPLCTGAPQRDQCHASVHQHPIHLPDRLPAGALAILYAPTAVSLCPFRNLYCLLPVVWILVYVSQLRDETNCPRGGDPLVSVTAPGTDLNT